MPRRRSSPSKFVKHPRYGALPHTSGLAVPEEEIRESFWSLQRETMFPESVLAARPDEQNYGTFPRLYYVDVLRNCRSCGLRFIFFAKEQRYWFETLKFFVDADCVLCPDCRRESRSINRRVRRYSDLMKRKARTPDDLQTLVDDATYLFERGTLRNVSTLGKLKNDALRSIPGYAGTVALAQALAKARRERRARRRDE
jgi:hypothetical protein